MGKYQAYPEYKDSGIEWLGDIPKEWELWKLTHAYEEIGSGTTPPSADAEWYGGNVPWVTTGELREKEIYSTAKNVTDDALRRFTALRKFPKGSIAIAMYGATIGRLGVFGVEATTNQACCVLTKSNVVDNHYLYYWLQAFRQDIVNLASGGGQPNINQEVVASLKISCPAKSEQKIIVSFLDHETAKIDTLIDKQQQLIQLLKEKRQAVISHAVTKGLNPNASMRDSGVEWLGEVPEHWMFATVRRYLLEHRQGYYSSEAYVDEGTKLLRITDLRGLGEVDTSSCPKVSWSESLNNYLLKEGDVVFARTGGAGSFGVIPKLKEDVAYASYLIRFRFLPKFFNTNYLRFMLIADSFQLAVRQNIHGGVNQNIHAEDIKNTFIASPPLDEQEEISKFLDAQTSKYAELINKAESQVELLQERRTALISAAVTGKIDVRHHASHPAGGLQPSKSTVHGDL